ncbi:glutathione S-transferase N-terminal domain-containing protein [Azohydromonas australica]|uniref:glutathione S-transferase N-terminal domain-containing protein n=1 Tax=Azohydromonas australica TaxID=364039 RepID=UPI00041C2EE2|nr:glutathione S-transferase N-terminal domain-containing protein [Azohydromonas australica]
MKLLSATPSPYARKVRIALAEKGLAFELVTEVPWDRDATAPRYNPLGKLPVLILDDGSTVFESHFILEWLEARYSEPPLVPRDVDGRLAARRLEVIADGVCDATVLTLFERLRGEGCSAPWLERQRRKIEAGTAALAQAVRPGATYVLGEAFGLADIATGTVLGYLELRLPEFDWKAVHPHLAEWFARISERPSFASTRPQAQRFSDPVV